MDSLGRQLLTACVFMSLAILNNTDKGKTNSLPSWGYHSTYRLSARSSGDPSVRKEEGTSSPTQALQLPGNRFEYRPKQGHREDP